jgi:hypothetical protein
MTQPVLSEEQLQGLIVLELEDWRTTDDIQLRPGGLPHSRLAPLWQLMVLGDGFAPNAMLGLDYKGLQHATWAC